jgi:hypothetical protein
MNGKSAPGRSTPTWKRPDALFVPRRVLLALLLIPIAATYVVEAFVAESPLLRIVLRTLPVLPVAAWTLWVDPSRPFAHRPALIRQGARIALLLLVMAFAVAVLGLGLNWLYDPDRVL